MPLIKFNKNIENLEDVLEIKANNSSYSKIKIVNILFEDGYENVSRLTLKVDNEPISLGIYQQPNSFAKIIEINKYFELKNNETKISVTCNGTDFAFSINVSCLYQN